MVGPARRAGPEQQHGFPSSQVPSGRRDLPVLFAAVLAVAAITLAGCGTTQWTDTRRAATEQLLISDAVDRAVSNIDVSLLQGRNVYFDDSRLKGVTDENYVISTLRQHILASGCLLKDKREEADYVVEARAGSVGTDRTDVLYGVPATTLPAMNVPGLPSTIPEIALGRKTEQRGVAKLAMFVYHRDSGRPLWQSGNSQQASVTKDIWVLGAGPLRKGTIYQEPQMVGVDSTLAGLFGGGQRGKSSPDDIAVAKRLYFDRRHDPREKVARVLPPTETAAVEAETAATSPPAAGEPPSPDAPPKPAVPETTSRPVAGPPPFAPLERQEWLQLGSW